jgi:hypothetical protein
MDTTKTKSINNIHPNKTKIKNKTNPESIVEKKDKILQSSQAPIQIQMSDTLHNQLHYSYNKYYSKRSLIMMIKHYVFLYKSLICGSFNIHLLKTNEYIKKFGDDIKTYETLNNIKFTNEQMYSLFTDINFSKDTYKRIELQTNMDILITKENVVSFLDTIKMICEKNYNGMYNVEYYDKGYFKEIVKSYGFHLDNHNDTNTNTDTNTDTDKIRLIVVNIVDPIYNNKLELHFIVFENEKKSLQSPLQIPYGLYHTEHLYMTNDGNDNLAIQYSIISIDEIFNNFKLNIISLFPNRNDIDYTNLSKYVKTLFKKLNKTNYLIEFNLFNKTNTKSDFILTNKNSNSLRNQDNSCNKCKKCNIMIDKNTKYVISKCCYSEYHIECMEMNYYQDCNFMSYLSCDCGFHKRDENECNSKLLCALYKHYY